MGSGVSADPQYDDNKDSDKLNCDTEIFEESSALEERLFRVAHFSAALKAGQMTLPLRESYFRDPYARFLAGNIGIDFVKDLRQNDETYYLRLFDIFGCRTKFVDDKIFEALRRGINQICVLSSGLDARAYRLDDDILVNPGVAYFEVDFEFLLSYKQKILAGMNARSKFNHIAVPSDLRRATSLWTNHLFEQGFNKFEPTIWVMEGFTQYRSRRENLQLLEGITGLSSSGSIIVMDVCTPAFKNINGLQGFKKFFKYTPNDPTDLMKKSPWNAVAHDCEVVINGMGKRRWCKDGGNELGGYYFVVSEMV